MMYHFRFHDQENDMPDVQKPIPMQTLIDALARVGLVLPEDCSPETLVRDLLVCANAMAGVMQDDEPIRPDADATAGAFMSTMRRGDRDNLIRDMQKRRDRATADQVARSAGLPPRGVRYDA
jgi:hypothetical protein